MTIRNVPPGVYAIVAFQDINGNNEFDKTLGVPREPYGVSGPAGEMYAPKFRDAVIEIKPGANDVTLRMKRFGH